MPLRSKVTNPAFAAKAQMSTATDSKRSSVRWDDENGIRELEGDEKEDVLFDTLFGVRTIELNRPAKFNSLNGSMVRKIVPRLQEWAKSDMANVVIIKGAGPKAFCAGGDVNELAKDNMRGNSGKHRSTDYFNLEYKLDHLIATYTKPYVAFLDGITMGGGVGLSVHAPFRIATEKTVFAMPETTIGFFPDVGGSFFLPRMPGAVGTYLALTSDRLKGANVFYAGIATHYLHSTSLPALDRRLAELRFKDYDPLPERLQLINDTIEEFCTGLPHDEPIQIAGKVRNAVDKCFGKETVPEILAALEEVRGNPEELREAESSAASSEDGGPSPLPEWYELRKWAETTLKTLHQRSPTAVYVTLRQMQLGRNWSIKETFQRELIMAKKFMFHGDFTEGVRALLIDKDKKPKWNPATLEDISPKDNVEEQFFATENEERLKLLNDIDYTKYPHARFGIPQESEIVSYMTSVDKSYKAIVDHFVQERKGKQGVKEVVEEVLNRKYSVMKNKK